MTTKKKLVNAPFLHRADDTKTYLIIGDNNFWYGYVKGTLKEARKELSRIKKSVEKEDGTYDDHVEASSLYLFEAIEIDNIELI